QAVEKVPAKDAGDLYIRYAKLEEKHGLMRHAASVLDRACAAVEEAERLDMFRLYVAKVSVWQRQAMELEAGHRHQRTHTSRFGRTSPYSPELSRHVSEKYFMLSDETFYGFRSFFYPVCQVESWYGVTQTRQVYEKAIKDLNEEGAREVRAIE
ncbi:unnamed protein product, partial [Hapterophycus canaliculatus]